MSISRVIGILAFVVQVLNGLLGILSVYKPQYAIIVAAIIGAIQAFTARVQGSSATADGQ